MTADDAIKAVFAALLAGLLGAVTWVVRNVLGVKEKVLLLEVRIKAQEDRVDEIKASQVTVECVREVIEEVLDRRDVSANERRAEWDRRHRLEIEAVVSDKLDSLVPRLAREIQGMNGKGK